MNLSAITDYLGVTRSQSREEARKEQFEKTKTLGPKEIFMEWTATSRPKANFLNVKLTRTFIIIGIFIGFLWVLMQEFILLLFAASVIFILYVLSKTPPEQVHYEISNHGVSYGDDMYYWEELKQFFFTQNSGVDILAIDTFIGLPGRLFLTIEDKDKEKLQKYLVEKIHYLEKEPRTVLDDWADKIAGKFKTS